MSVRQTAEPEYGNWVSTKLIYGSIAMSISFFVLSSVFPIFVVGTIPFLLSFAYFAYARHMFSQRGGNLQAPIRNLVVEHLDWDGEGKVLDIGCGNAPLAIELAKRYPSAQVTGIDYWGGMWEYSKAVCERNAEIEGVAGRMNFQKASAAALPFEDEYFDAAVSNLVFHEVGDVKDKRELIKEALRVVKRGGVFAFQDLFLLKRHFGKVDDLVAMIKSWGIKEMAFADTSDSEFIPKALRLPFMVGRIRIIYGKK
ncbi:MAG: class I SAM-dependent methyltransferase [Ignavibacteriales bacterium]|nr:class I SAM-dependent methyltransferase [Ignavibacteriales bacterium]